MCGSRTASPDDYPFVKLTLDKLIAKHEGETITIVSGGAKGVDKMAENYAKERNYAILVFKADWDTFGNAAGYMRNVGIVNASDEVAAFWDMKSPGTKHTIDITKKAGKPSYVIPLPSTMKLVKT